jgi:hypothetical protein
MPHSYGSSFTAFAFFAFTSLERRMVKTAKPDAIRTNNKMGM